MWPEQAKNLRSTARLHHALLIEVFKTQVRACVSIFLEADYYSLSGTNVSFAGDLTIQPLPSSSRPPRTSRRSSLSWTTASEARRDPRPRRT